jgi:predicted RNA binding protein YcfA (HicA-like mRNA interferase family)
VKGGGPEGRCFSQLAIATTAQTTLDRVIMGLMPMKVREVIRLLETHGWVEMRSKGSHRHFKHPNQPYVVTVPGNSGMELAPGTLNVILKKAGLK